MPIMDEIRYKTYYVTINYGKGRKKKEQYCYSLDDLYNILNQELFYAKKIIIESE
jgi:hypothetical protein